MLLSKRPGADSVPDGDSPDAQQTAAPDTGPDSDLVNLPDSPGKPDTGSSQVKVGSAIQYRRLPVGSGEALFVLNAKNSRTSEKGWLDLEGITLTYPSIGVVTAERGRIAVDANGQLWSGDPTAGTGGRLELENCVLVFDEGHRMAPARIDAPRLEANYDERTLTLLGRPTWTAQTLVVSGERIDLNLTAETVDAQGDTIAQWIDDTDQVAMELRGDRLFVRASDPLRLIADMRGNARLELAPRDPLEEPLVLTAPNIELEGERANEQASFAPTAVRIDGGVGQLSSGDAQLSGRIFEFDFQGETRPERITVREEASLSLPVTWLWPAESQAEVQDLGAFTLTAADELELGAGRNFDVRARGASTLTLGELVLDAGDGFTGEVNRDEAHVHLDGRGGLVLNGFLPPNVAGERVAIEHRSQTLVIDHWTTETGTRLELATAGAAVFAAGLDAPEGARFQAERGLALEVVRADKETSWSLTNAGDVTFSAWKPDERVEGTATQLQELNTKTLTFGGTHVDVHRETSDGRAFDFAGELVDVQGETNINLQGQARFAGNGLDLRADTLTRKGANFDAQGHVRAELVTPGPLKDGVRMPGQRAMVNCDTFKVEGFRIENQKVVATLVLAEGNLSGSGSFQDTQIDFSASAMQVEGWGERNLLTVAGRSTFHVVEGGRDWTIQADLIKGHTLLDVSHLTAEGNLVVDETSIDFHGTGERLELNRAASVEAILEGGVELAEVRGLLPGTEGSFNGRVARIVMAPDLLEMEQLSGVLRGFALPGSDRPAADLELRAEHLLSVTETTPLGLRDVLQLDGRVFLSRLVESGPPEVFRADHVTFLRVRKLGESASLAPALTNTSFIAHGEISMRQGAKFVAFGEHLEVSAPSQRMRFAGTPASIVYAGLTINSVELVLDPETMLVESKAGSVSADAELMQMLNPNAGDQPWILYHEGLEGRQEGELVLEILQKPRLEVGALKLSANAGLFWLDRLALESRRQLGRQDVDPERNADVLDHLPKDPAASILREVYFEGPVEYQTNGERVGSAEAMYLDLREKRGWLANAELQLKRKVRDREVTWSARAAWMQRTPEGTLLSNDAVITPCVFVDEHLAIQTGNLIVRRADEDDPNSFRVNLHGNSLKIYDLVSLPLPPFAWDAADDGAPLIPELKLGSSARFGSFVQTGVSIGADGLGNKLHTLLGGEPNKVRSDAHVGVSWLGSRGILLDFSLDLVAKGKYWLDMAVGGLYDDARDRGLIRVDQDDRSDLRTWFRSRGRYLFNDKSWLDLAVSTESDPGVQSEFYEDEFLNYEQRENYLHWRTSSGNRFFSVRLKVQVDKARSQIEELPAMRATIDRTAFQPFGDTTMLYSSNSTLGWYNRIAGSTQYQSPFALQAPFADGLGDTHVLRVDSKHRVEMPVDLPSQWKLIPFVEGRATLWDRDQTNTDEPSRFDLNSGLRLTTLFWNRLGSGTTAQIAPFVQTSINLAHTDGGGAPFLLDATDLATGANEHSIGVRSRVYGWREDEEVDIEVLAKRSEPDAGGELDTFEVFAGWQTHIFDMPVGFSHDGRYSLDDGLSLVSHSLLGLRPTENLGIELSHSRAVDELDAPYYEAGTVRGVYRWTEKWEFEASQTLSVLEDTNLVYETLLRRYGHDLVFEVGVSRVAGEGGTTFTIKVRPELLFRRSPLGYANHR